MWTLVVLPLNEINVVLECGLKKDLKKPGRHNVKFSICCQRGDVQLPLLKKPPQLLYSLMCGAGHRSNHFKQNIRAYNSMFSFTSIGGKVESSMNDGGGPP